MEAAQHNAGWAATLRPRLLDCFVMTQTTNPAEEHLCDACAGIQRNWRKAPGHAELMQRGNRKEERGSSTVTVTRYVCERCGTVWDYENNKQNQKAGWSVIGRV